ncbi:MAG TPA: hypothetical protein V6D14_01695 [Coleofasciculaceae cyanobacterium]|jgi:hypothetical protein
MKPKLSLAVILSTTAIASGVLLGSVSPIHAYPCARSKFHSKSDYYQERYEQASWLRSPLTAAITLPGIAIAAALSVGYRHYKG